MRFRWFVLMPLWLAMAHPAICDPFPARSGAFINDHAEVLSDGEEAELGDFLAQLDEETGIETVVVSIASRQDYDPSVSIEAFATRLFNGWGIGDGDRNDGILVLVARDDRELRIELGSAYDQGYDVLAADIVQRFFLPDLKDGEIGRAIVAGTTETVERIARPFAASAPAEIPVKTGPWLPAWLPAAGVAGVIVFLILRRRPSSPARTRKCPDCGHVGLIASETPPAQATPGKRAARPRALVCPRCGHREDGDDRRSARRLAAREDRETGGGRSSGGGASGRW